jgi:phosphoglycerate kinase
MAKKTLRDVDVAGRRVLVRVDFNVPLEEGRIADDARIRASLPTIRELLARGARVVVLASHLGRPKGRPDPALSLRPVADRLAELLGRPVRFAEDCVGGAAERALAEAAPGSVVLLENLRFHPEEERNDEGFARALARLADVYVNDAFGAAHRAHASTEAVTRFVPDAVAGLLMEKELEFLGRALERPERPFVAILGGAKVSDKLEVVRNLVGRVDALLIGGAMAYTFLRARGVDVGRSLVEPELEPEARRIEEAARGRAVAFELPLDHVVADRLEPDAAVETLAVGDPAIDGRLGADIGPRTIGRYRDRIRSARTVVWNGPMGVFEIDAFARGTLEIARAVASVDGTTIVGGGDSIAAVRKAGVADRITHISTGGGASLEFLGGRRLPGVEALADR